MDDLTRKERAEKIAENLSLEFMVSDAAHEMAGLRTSLRGVIVDEDLFFAMMKEIPDFKKILSGIEAEGVYILPVTERQQYTMQTDLLAKKGYVATPSTREAFLATLQKEGEYVQTKLNQRR